MTTRPHQLDAHVVSRQRAAVMWLLYRQGWSMVAIGQAHGISGVRVGSLLRKHGYMPRKSGRVIEGY